MKDPNEEASYITSEGWLDSMGCGYLEQIFVFFIGVKQHSLEKVELVFTSTKGGGHILKDGVKYIEWADFRDGHERIEKLIERIK